MGKITQYAFWLLVILIISVYYVGAKSNVESFGGALNQLLLTLSGRSSDGTFANYPKQG